jgi:hypothetical protein
VLTEAGIFFTYWFISVFVFRPSSPARRISPHKLFSAPFVARLRLGIAVKPRRVAAREREAIQFQIRVSFFEVHRAHELIDLPL